MIETRAAFRSEYPLLRELFTQAFHEDEPELFDHLVAHDRSMTPDTIRVAVKDGAPVACTVALPRQIRCRQGLVPAAIITLVACRPDVQGQGYGGATVRGALAWMAGQGLAFGILYGHPGYYPRFGFAPVLPGTALTLKADGGAGTLVEAAASDLPWITDLYDRQIGIYPGAVARQAEPWLWALRNPAVHAIRTLPDRRGYAYVGQNQRENSLDVMEAAAVDGTAARELVTALRQEARARGREKLRLLLPPTAPVARAAALMGAEQRVAPAGAGMACITDWAAVLPEGYTLTETGLARGGRPVLTASRAVLTQLALGYHSGADLVFLDGVTVENGAREQLERDFAPAFPRWSLAPFWHGL